ncbi:hypothetical protein [Streptomyces sp. MNP-20]|nr:hypothetical protein [Streptomyces sp. MNP-20]
MRTTNEPLRPQAMLEFFGHPGRHTSTAAQVGLQAMDWSACSSWTTCTS